MTSTQSVATPSSAIDAQVASIDAQWMHKAIAAARHGRPSPNPNVGAVIVRDGCLVGVGHHERAGREHAEVAAFKNATSAAVGATLYVTLEPCNHFGRTGPCTKAILAAGIARVVIGALDPNPCVAGGGAHVLREAGLEVHVGVLADEAQQLVAAWSKVQLQRVAHVSLDSRVGSLTHYLRNDFDAFLLDVESIHDVARRAASHPDPVRVLFDPNLEAVNDLSTMAAAGPARWLVVSTPEALQTRAPLATNARIEWLATNEPFSTVPRLLAERGIVKVLATLGRESTRFLQGAGAIDAFVHLDD